MLFSDKLNPKKVSIGSKKVSTDYDKKVTVPL
jgi:hypothetical protein